MERGSCSHDRKDRESDRILVLTGQDAAVPWRAEGGLQTAMALKRAPEPEGSSARKLSTTRDRPHWSVLTAAFTRQGRCFIKKINTALPALEANRIAVEIDTHVLCAYNLNSPLSICVLPT